MESSIYFIFLGLILILLSFDRHFKQLSKKSLGKAFKYITNIYGAIFLIVSLVKLVNIFGLSLGITYWFGFLGLAIVFIAVVFAYRPKTLVALIAVYPLLMLFT